MKKVKFGIIGTGVIATQFATEALREDLIELVGVSAQDIEKTKAFAKKFSIPHAYETAEDLFNNTEIDAIYVATFHPTHPSYSIDALKYGKHVLCEKPAALTVEQIKTITELAKEKGKLFMEAMTIGFQPVYQEVKELIASGVIGEVTHVESSSGKMSKKAHKHTPELAGGCVYDIGIYNLFLIYDLLGKVESIQTQKRMHREWDVVGTVQMLAQHESGTQSYSYMTMDSISTGKATIIGTEGTIELGQNTGWTQLSHYKITKSTGEVIEKEYPLEKWLGYEMHAFAELVLEGKLESNIMPHSSSIALQEMIAMIYDKEQLTLPDTAIK